MSDASFMAGAVRFPAAARVAVNDVATPTPLPEDYETARFVKAVGTITAARAVLLPNIDGADYLIENGTAGGYGVTFKATVTDIGVTIMPGDRVLARCDEGSYSSAGAAGPKGDKGDPGPAGAPGGGYATLVVTSDAVTLNATQTANSVFRLTGTPSADRTVTLAAQSLNDGSTFLLWNDTDHSQTVSDANGALGTIAVGEKITYTRELNGFGKIASTYVVPQGGDVDSGGIVQTVGGKTASQVAAAVDGALPAMTASVRTASGDQSSSGSGGSGGVADVVVSTAFAKQQGSGTSRLKVTFSGPVWLQKNISGIDFGALTILIETAPETSPGSGVYSVWTAVPSNEGQRIYQFANRIADAPSTIITLPVHIEARVPSLAAKNYKARVRWYVSQDVSLVVARTGPSYTSDSYIDVEEVA